MPFYLAWLCKKGQYTKKNFWLLTRFSNIFAPHIKNLETHFAILICFEFWPQDNVHSSASPHGSEGDPEYTFHCWLEHVWNSKKNARTSRTYFWYLWIFLSWPQAMMTPSGDQTVTKKFWLVVNSEIFKGIKNMFSLCGTFF